MFSSIVVGTDGSEAARSAVSQAIELAGTVGARLQVVSAYEPVTDPRQREMLAAPAEEWLFKAREDVLAMLEEVTAEARAAGVEDVETFARQGDAADAILDVAEEQHCDLVIVGNRGLTGAERFLLGSVPNKVSHHAPCSVLIVRAA
jgi:nucleotide-binding universal stress UspA family protein